MAIDDVVDGNGIANAIALNRAGDEPDYSNWKPAAHEPLPELDETEYVAAGSPPLRSKLTRSRRREAVKPLTAAERNGEIAKMYHTLSGIEVVSREDDGVKAYLTNGRDIDYAQVPRNQGVITIAGLATYLLQKQGVQDPAPEQVVKLALSSMTDLAPGLKGDDARESYRRLFDPTSREGGNAPNSSFYQAQKFRAPGAPRQVGEPPALEDPAADKPEPGTALAASMTPLGFAASRPYQR